MREIEGYTCSLASVRSIVHFVPHDSTTPSGNVYYERGKDHTQEYGLAVELYYDREDNLRAVEATYQGIISMSFDKILIPRIPESSVPFK